MTPTPYDVYLEAALGDPSKEHGVQFVFNPKGTHTSPFDISDWPDIRSRLRNEARQRVEKLDQWESYLLSDRVGERLTVTLGEVHLDDDGDVVEWNLLITTPDDVDW